ETREIAATGHNLTPVAKKPATCEEAGTEAYWICETCKKLFSDEAGTTVIEAPTVIPATGHAYGEWTQTKAPTCTEAGEEQRVCANDATHIETRAIEATGHAYGEWTETKAPTCTEAGEEQRVCANDPTHIETREIAATGHNLTPVAKKPATCEEAGTEAYWICETCKKLFSNEVGTAVIEAPIVIPATGHAYGEWTQTKAPTCTEAGEEQRVCANDPTHIETREIAATGHDWNDWVEVKPATCEETGFRYRTCKSNTAHIEQENIPATGHKLTPVAKKPATCEEAGTEAYWTCEACGKLFSDEAGTTVIEAPTVIPATGHAYGDWTQTKAPTCTEAGEEQRVCANDPTHIETREIAAIGHKWAQPAKSDWSWSADLKTAKVTIHCENDATHTQDLSAKVESKVTKEATPTANGVRTYTATAKTPDGKTLTDTRTEVIPKTAKEIQATDVTVSNVVYNGAAQKTAVVKVDGKTLKEGTDYTATYKANTNVGKATVTVEGKGSYYTAKPITKTFQITPASIKNAQVSGISAKTYTGSAITQKPVVKMTLNEKPVTLKSGTDYTVTYKNNTKVGTATVTITGKGNFKDTVNRTFKINAASIAKATVSGLSDQVYDGTAKKPVPTVKLGDKTLKAGTDYTVSYKNNTNAGTATVTITGKGNYSGTLTKTFKITMSQAKLERFAGANRYETAFQAADELKKVMGVSKFSAVVVADGQNFPDALASAYLAKVKKAPTLLTTPSRFAETQSYIRKNLQPGGTIYIVGGPGSVPEAFRNGLAGFKIKRLGGKDRYETDLLVLQEAGIKTKEFIVVDGTSFEDALSASATGMPVLLVYGAGADLREPQVQYLSSLNREGTAHFYLVGGTDVISGDLQRRLSTYGSVERVGSGDAYDRSLAIARKFFPGYQKHINLAGGENFADGLAGGPVAMAKGGPLILTNNTAATFNKALSYAKAAHATEASIFGGTVWISDKVAETILQTGKEAWPTGYQHE
ncbi:MAG: cell wall-binding repeat-containing protein, partial [Firmicutes bacterium]|nr:cell wall-binding repeat-containing protein [Bacillota bacterium]